MARRSSRTRPTRPTRWCTGRAGCGVGGGLGQDRSARIGRQLGHQHRQRILRRAAVHRTNLERVRRRQIRPHRRQGHQRAADGGRELGPGRPRLGRLAHHLRPGRGARQKTSARRNLRYRRTARSTSRPAQQSSPCTGSSGRPRHQRRGSEQADGPGQGIRRALANRHHPTGAGSGAQVPAGANHRRLAAGRRLPRSPLGPGRRHHDPQLRDGRRQVARGRDQQVHPRQQRLLRRRIHHLAPAVHPRHRRGKPDGGPGLTHPKPLRPRPRHHHRTRIPGTGNRFRQSTRRRFRRIQPRRPVHTQGHPRRGRQPRHRHRARRVRTVVPQSGHPVPADLVVLPRLPRPPGIGVQSPGHLTGRGHGARTVHAGHLAYVRQRRRRERQGRPLRHRRRSDGPGPLHVRDRDHHRRLDRRRIGQRRHPRRPRSALPRGLQRR